MDEEGRLRPWLLVSDIDDTLTGDKLALEKLWQAISDHPDRVKLALNSSRPAASVDETIASYFPTGFAPDAIITGMGTEIRVNGEFLEDWSRQFSHWPRAEIAAIVEAMGYTPHDAVLQTPAKASFAVPGKEVAQAVLRALEERELPFQALFSGVSDLDILAPGAGKGTATRYLAAHLGIPMEKVVAAGDSGNDLALFQAAAKNIAVGNARAELLDACPAGKTYRAKAPHAAGIYEGLIEFGILPAH